MNRIIFITGVSGVGKTFIYENIKDSELKDTYNIFDIDKLVNINDYDSENINNFYKDAIDIAISKSKDKDIILFSCINHNDVEDLKLNNYITRLVLIVCENDVLEKRLKSRNNDCSSDEFIRNQINYQNWFISNLDYYDANYVKNIEKVSFIVEKVN